MKKEVTLKLQISVSKIFAYMITIMGFVLSLKSENEVYFITVIPVASTLIGLKQYFDKQKNVNDGNNKEG
ncbi:MAG: hypothetical protein WC389_16045 [Lutibacter sp.]|jgi:hypothetical protein